MTNLGPLTTKYTPADRCSVAVGGCDDGYCTAVFGHTCDRTQTSVNSGCWPSASAFLGHDYIQSAFFSPASDCPQGWSTATVGVDTSIFPELASTQIGIMCCPSGMRWDLHIGCYATTDYAQSVTFCSDRPATVWHGFLSDQLTAAPIQLRHDATPSPTSSIQFTASPTSRPEPTDISSRPSNSGLTVGAEIAIIATLSTALTISALLSLLLWLRRKTSTQNQDEDDFSTTTEAARQRAGTAIFLKPFSHKKKFSKSAPDMTDMPELILPKPSATTPIYEVDGGTHSAVELSANTISHDVRRSRSYELSATSPSLVPVERTINAMIDTSYNSDDDLTLNQLRARRAAVKAERERLKRLQELREEERRLGVAIERMEGDMGTEIVG